MNLSISRSGKKREAKTLETLAHELTELSATDIRKLPCGDALKEEITLTKTLKGGARKRQQKHIAKELRNMEPEPLYDFLTEKKGSRLRQNKEFHALEQLREQIIDEVLHAAQLAQQEGEILAENWKSSTVESIGKQLPSLDLAAVNRAAVRYGRSRKPAYRREIFRQLRAAHERLGFQDRAEKEL
jgi:ribosome-associated protein